MTTTYVVGEFATIVTTDGVVLTAPDRLADVVDLGERGLAPLTVVEVLSRGALSDLPDFVATTVVGGELRVIVRGAFAVRTDGFAVDGVGVATWTERSAPLAAGAVVEVMPVGTTPGGPALPLTGGVVRSAGVRWVPVGSVPERTVVKRPRPASPPPAAPPVDAPATPPATLLSPAAAAPPTAPPTAPPPVPAPATPPPPFDVDHDGRTTTPAQLEAMRSRQARQDVATGSGAPTVAVELSNGRVIPIRRRVLIGRSPRVQQVGSSANLPALITVDDPYVSGTHLEVSFDEGRVLVTDTSTNGTLLSRQGRVPVQLGTGVATEVAIGDVLTLSKGLTATIVPTPVR